MSENYMHELLQHAWDNLHEAQLYFEGEQGQPDSETYKIALDELVEATRAYWKILSSLQERANRKPPL